MTWVDFYTWSDHFVPATSLMYFIYAFNLNIEWIDVYWIDTTAKFVEWSLLELHSNDTNAWGKGKWKIDFAFDGFLCCFRPDLIICSLKTTNFVQSKILYSFDWNLWTLISDHSWRSTWWCDILIFWMQERIKWCNKRSKG